MTLTREQGKQWAKDFFAAFQAGFAHNTHPETLKPFLAETMSWDWSDGFVGTNEPSSKVTEHFAQTWGFMVEKVIADPIVLVSTTDDRIEMFSPKAVIQINGGLPQSHVVGQPVSFSMTVKDGKATNWVGLWDQGDEAMNEALGKVTQALEAAKSIPRKTHTSLYIYRYILFSNDRTELKARKRKNETLLLQHKK